jgi:hypothetical protein
VSFAVGGAEGADAADSAALSSEEEGQEEADSVKGAGDADEQEELGSEASRSTQAIGSRAARGVKVGKKGVGIVVASAKIAGDLMHARCARRA